MSTPPADDRNTLTTALDAAPAGAAAARRTAPFRLGFFTYLRGDDAPGVYRRVIDLFVAAEELGFDTGWVAQHHFGGIGGLPSPLVFLPAVAEATERIALGTAVITLPLEDGFRVAEDAAVFEALYPGRLELGFGTGFPGEATATLGPDGDRRTRYEAEIATVRSAFEGAPLNEHGSVLHPPAGGLGDRLWEGTASADGVEGAGRRGSGLLLSRVAWSATGTPTDQAQAPFVERHRRLVLSQGGRPRLGLSRTVYPAADRATAVRDLEPGVRTFSRMAAERGMLPAVSSVEQLLVANNIHHGHPDEVAASLEREVIFPHMTDLICQTDPGDLTDDQVLAALERLATQVAPSLGWSRHVPDPHD